MEFTTIRTGEAQAQAQRDNNTVSECDFEVFLSEMEQDIGAVNNTRQDTRESDSGEDSSSDPDNPLLGRLRRISLKPSLSLVMTMAAASRT